MERVARKREAVIQMARNRNANNKIVGSLPSSASFLPAVWEYKGQINHPVTIKKAPTEPIHPTRMCLGKTDIRLYQRLDPHCCWRKMNLHPIKLPSLSAPRAKKATPVKTEDIAKETMVVAMISSGNSGPMPLIIFFAITCMNGTLSIIILPFPRYDGSRSGSTQITFSSIKGKSDN